MGREGGGRENKMETVYPDKYPREDRSVTRFTARAKETSSTNKRGMMFCVGDESALIPLHFLSCA